MNFWDSNYYFFLGRSKKHCNSVSSTRAISNVNSHIERHIERGIPQLNKPNSRRCLEGVESPRGASPDKPLLISTPRKCRIPTGSFACMVTSFDYFLFPLGKACRVARVKYKFWICSGRWQMMISARPVSQILQCPVHAWCLLLLKLISNRREEAV